MGIYEDWRNRKLQELIDAGIDPFFQLDMDNMPANATDWATHFPGRKIFGNAIDGIPAAGIVFNPTDKTMRYQNAGFFGGTYSWDTTALQMIQTGTNTSAMSKNQEIHGGDVGAVTIANDGVLPNDKMNLYTHQCTLAAGVLANEELLPAVAARNNVIVWMAINTNTLATDYTITLHDDAGAGAEARLWVVGQGTDNPSIHKLGEKIWVHMVNTTANSATQVDIAGGAGVEEVYITYLGKNTGTF